MTKFNSPVALFYSPRGGSSLVAGIFVAHGFWTGKTFGGKKGIGSGGYVNHENALIKEFVKFHWPLNAGEPVTNPGHADLWGYCETVVPPDTLWLAKGPSEHYPIFAHHFPQMSPVFVFRDEEQAVLAHVRRRGEKVREVAKRVVRARYAYMRDLAAKDPRIVLVKADDVVDGDFSAIETVLNRYGIELDRNLAESKINREIWHRSAVGGGEA